MNRNDREKLNKGLGIYSASEVFVAAVVTLADTVAATSKAEAKVIAARRKKSDDALAMAKAAAAEDLPFGAVISALEALRSSYLVPGKGDKPKMPEAGTEARTSYNSLNTYKSQAVKLQERWDAADKAGTDRPSFAEWIGSPKVENWSNFVGWDVPKTNEGPRQSSEADAAEPKGLDSVAEEVSAALADDDDEENMSEVLRAAGTFQRSVSAQLVQLKAMVDRLGFSGTIANTVADKLGEVSKLVGNEAARVDAVKARKNAAA